MKPSFDSAFRAQFRDLVLWRRDVRRFRGDPVPRERIDALIEIATHAPSVASNVYDLRPIVRVFPAGPRLTNAS